MKKTTPAEFEITDAMLLQGGLFVPVKRLVGKKVVKEKPLVRLLPIAQYPRLFAALEDEAQLAAFVCGKDLAWGASLTPDSLNEVADAAMNLNFQSACRWANRQARNGEATKEMQAAVMRAVPLLSSLFASVAGSAPAAPQGK